MVPSFVSTNKGELRNTKGTVDPMVAMRAIAQKHPTATILNGHANGEQLFVDIMMK